MKRENQGSISIAFLDLLSGALAGVIILFLIVPKGTSFAAGELDDQKLSIDSLFIVIDSLYLGKDTLTSLDIALLRETMSSLRSRVDSIEQTAISYRTEAIQSKARQVVLEDSLRQMRLQQRQDKAKVEQAKQAIASREKSSPQRLPTRSPIPSPNKASVANTTPSPSTSTTSPSTGQPTPQSAAGKADPRDPMPEMLDPFMIDVRWSDKQDVDLLLLNKAGVVLCNDSRCNKKFAAHERSGKRDTSQYERMRVISREPETYEVRLAIHSRLGGGKGEASTPVSGTFYVKTSPNSPATKHSFATEVAPRQRGDNGAPGVRIGSLTITDSGEATFTTDPS